MNRLPLRHIDQIDQPAIRHEQVNVLARARILWANDDAIRRDFPIAWTGRNFANLDAAGLVARRLRRQFILQNAAVVSTSQTEENEVNEHIPITGEKRQALRPPGYGRALIVEALPIMHGRAGNRKFAQTPIGILDVKGVGLGPGLRPQIANHLTGILPLPMAFEEIANQRLIDSIMKAEGVDVAGAPIYALIDLGFRARIPGSNLLPCAAIVRAAYQRPRDGADLPQFGSDEQRVQIMLELILRKYGITSVTPMTEFCIRRDISGQCSATYGSTPIAALRTEHIEAVLQHLGIELSPNGKLVFGALNIQLARGLCAKPLSATIIDFGHYNATERFDTPLLSLISGRPLNWGGVLWPTDANWIQPDPRKCRLSAALKFKVDDEQLCQHYGLPQSVRSSRITVFALRLARKVELKDMQCASIIKAMDRLVAKAIIQ